MIKLVNINLCPYIDIKSIKIVNNKLYILYNNTNKIDYMYQGSNFKRIYIMEINLITKKKTTEYIASINLKNYKYIQIIYNDYIENFNFAKQNGDIFISHNFDNKLINELKNNKHLKIYIEYDYYLTYNDKNNEVILYLDNILDNNNIYINNNNKYIKIGTIYENIEIPINLLIENSEYIKNMFNDLDETPNELIHSSFKNIKI